MVDTFVGRLVKSFGGRHESDIVIKAVGKWKYNGEKGMGADPAGNENKKYMWLSLVYWGFNQQ